MEKTNVLVVGGSAAGIVTAVVGKSNYPDKEFLLVRKEKEVLVPCGIPYIFGTLKNIDKNNIPDAVLGNAGVNLKIGEVVTVDTENNVCALADGTEIGYEKLVLATGSTPSIPGWLKGAEHENVFTIKKDKEYLANLLSKLEAFKKIVIIGGGFIGVEVADELNKLGKDITIVEILPHLLGLVFDEQMTVRVEELLGSRGVTIKNNNGVREICGEGTVSHVLLNSGEELEADAVICALGYQPNSTVAEKSGIDINSMGYIIVDEYMRTHTPNVFAVGDCAEKRDFFSRRLSKVMLASTATSEARIAGMNLYNLSAVKTFGGTISIFSTAIGDDAFGAAGLIESTARKEGFNIVTGTFEGVDRHPGSLADTHKQMVKLIVARESGIILGGEVYGGSSAGELINLLGYMVQNKMSINNVLTSQIGTHPLLTAPPTAYPLIKAAENVLKIIKANNNA